MKTIKLTQGYDAIIDDEDYERLVPYKWQACVDVRARTVYVKRSERVNGKKETFRLHREVLRVTDKNIHIDHENGNGLDNRKGNLRICSVTQNAQNRRKPRSYKGLPTKSKYKGVRSINDIKRKAKWQAIIQYNGKRINVGRFLTEKEAAEAYNLKAKELFGEFAYLNAT